MDQIDLNSTCSTIIDKNANISISKMQSIRLMDLIAIIDRCAVRVLFVCMYLIWYLLQFKMKYTQKKGRLTCFFGLYRVENGKNSLRRILLDRVFLDHNNLLSIKPGIVH